MRTLKLLLAEDSDTIAAEILDHLERSDLEVRPKRVRTAAELDTEIQNDQWDIVVSAARLGGFNAVEAFSHLRGAGWRTPFLIVTESEGDDDAYAAVEAGVDGIVSKQNLRMLLPLVMHAMRAAASVDAQHAAEDALRESEERYRMLAETASDAIVTVDAQGRVLFVNEAAGEIFGYSPPEMLGQNLSMLMAADLRRAADARLSRTGIEMPARRKDGTEITVQVSFGEYRHKGRHLFSGIIRDVTESRRAERALRESEQDFRGLARATSQFVWTAAADGTSEELFRWFSELSGTSVNMLEDMIALMHPDDVADASAAWTRSLKRKSLFEFTCRFMSRDGTYRFFVARSFPLYNADRSFRRWIGTFTDVHEQMTAAEALRRSEEQLTQAQKLESIGILAGGISHDFNNMLTAINGYSELILRRLAADDPVRSHVEEILKAGERSAALTRQLLAFSRRQILLPKLLNINETIAETATMLERLIGEHITISTALNDSLWSVEADPGQLVQVLMNLAVNARDAMPDGGSIVFETDNVRLDEPYAIRHVGAAPGEYVMLAVSDTGTGIDEMTLKRIFEPFFTTKETGKGTGLGLSTVYGIIKQSGGNVWVYSEPGEGTTFKVYLPRVRTVAEANKDTESRQPGHGTETILLVEDEEIVRTLSREVLETYGYKVVEARNGVEALDLLASDDTHVDLLMTDIVMPQMGGRELARMAWDRRPGLRVLFASGYTDDAVMRHGIIDEGTNFIQKPFTADALTKKVRSLLDSPTQIH